MLNKSIDQDQEQILNQYSSVPSKLSDQTQRSDQDEAKLAVLKSGVILDVQFKKEVNSLLEKENPFMEILAELKEWSVEIKKNKKRFKMKRGMLVVHKDGQDTDLNYWRIIIPDSTNVKIFVVTELHAVPYSIHPGMQRTLQKVCRHFY